MECTISGFKRVRNHASYSITTSMPANKIIGPFTTERRFKEFLKLHDSIHTILSLKPAFPLSVWAKSYKTEVMEERSKSLQVYLNYALQQSSKLGIAPPAALLGFLNVASRDRDSLGGSEVVLGGVESFLHGAPNERPREELEEMATHALHDGQGEKATRALHEEEKPATWSKIPAYVVRSRADGKKTVAIKEVHTASSVSVHALWKIPLALVVLVLGSIRQLLSLVDGFLVLCASPLTWVIETKKEKGGRGGEAEKQKKKLGPRYRHAVLKGEEGVKPEGGGKKEERREAGDKDAVVPLVMSAAASSLFAHMDPIVRSQGKIPLFVLPPGGVTSWKDLGGGKLAIELDSKYQRLIVDTLGTFEVTFDKKVSARLADGGLSDLKGVSARRVGIAISASVARMKLPAAGQDKVAFTAKPRFLPAVTLAMQLTHFDSVDKWSDAKKL